ncbi:MAG: hypothetical protein QM765_17955 [Myxococcales bacterium]
MNETTRADTKKAQHVSRALVRTSPANHGTPLRVLFLAEAVSLAHVARPSVLARWAREAGHEVFFACGDRFTGPAREAGLDPIPLPTVSPESFYRRLSQGRFFYDEAELETYVRAEVELIRETKPDLIVGDFRLTMSIAAKLTSTPCLALANAYWSPAAREAMPAPETGFLRSFPRGLRDGLFALVRPLAYRTFAKPLDRIRERYGLLPLRDFRRSYTDGERCAYLDLPGLFPLSTLPAGHLHLGPVLWNPSVASDAGVRLLGLQRPLAYVTLGTTGAGLHLPQLLESLLETGCDVVVSGVADARARALRLDLPGLEGRSFITELIDPSDVLQRAALTVCHGGSGTVYQSLAMGVPVLGFPGNPDQHLVCLGLQLAGAGLAGNWKHLKSQLLEMLGGTCRSAARRLASEIQRHDTRGRWLEFLRNPEASCGSDRASTCPEGV